MRRIIGFDTETYFDRGEYVFLSAQFYSRNPKLNMFITNPEDLKKVFTHKTRGCIFLALNAEYDFSVLRKAMKNNYFDFYVLYNSNRFVCGKLVRNKHVWHIWDLQNIFLNWSLKKVGELIGVQKLEKPLWLGLRKPESKEEWKQLKVYAMNDAKICYLAGEWLLKKFGTLKLTLPSLSFHVYNKCYKRFPIYLSKSDSEIAQLRLAYKGGRCEVFIRGSPDNKVYVYDVVSLYPYIMWKSEFPIVTEPLKEKPSLDLSKEGVAYCLIEQDHEIPLLCTRLFVKDGEYKLVFPNGKFASWFTYPELRYLEWKGLGKIIRVFKAYECSETAPIFKDFVEKYFSFKVEQPEASSFWKLFLNSLYGKFAQSCVSPWIKVLPDLKLEKVHQTVRKKFVPRRNIIIAAYITAKARIYMHSLYEKVGLKHLVYTDTDSIHTTKKLTDVGENLGELSFKGESDGERRATYIRSKFYIFNSVLKCKGLKGLLTADEMRKLISLGNAKVLSTIILKLRSAYARHMNVLSTVKMEKQFTLGDDGKRVYLKHLRGRQLLEDYSESRSLVLNVLG